MKKNINKTGRGRQKNRKRRGETLVEVIIAIVVVAIGSGTATALIVTALVSNSFSRDNLIAMNLATEGIEAMRSIRDTNWMKFSYDKTNCWNVDPEIEVAASEPCGADNLIPQGHFTINLDPENYKWSLSNYSSPLDLHGGGTSNQDYRLYFNDVTPDIDTDGDGDISNDHDLYTSRVSSTGSETGESIFYRMITIDYDTPVTLPEDATKMTVTSLVQWKSKNTVHQVRIRSVLANYQKVKK